MPDLLDPDIARALARRLKVVKNYPWDEEANNATAECLIRWCRGAFEGRRIWKPLDQAEWLITELIDRVAESGEEWEGIAQLRAVYRERFLPAPEQQTYTTALPPSCEKCGDTGWESIEINGYSSARLCSCGGKRKSAVVCGECSGKETILLDGKRKWCKCVTPERRAQLKEWFAGMLRDTEAS